MLARERALARIADADYVFSGPGSPTYTLGLWDSSPLPDVLAASSPAAARPERRGDPALRQPEGGIHDTRFCYLGERRLRLLESMLEVDTVVLGVDEHTAAVFVSIRTR